MDELAYNGNGSTTTFVPPSGTQAIDGSLIGVKWSGAISYSDPDSPNDYQVTYQSDQDGDGFSAQNEGFSRLNASQQQAMHFALDADDHAASAGFAVEGFTNLNIAYAGAGSGASTIRIANSSDPATSYAFYPSVSQTGGDVWIGTSARSAMPGTYSWHTMLHEIGHSLGLAHGHDGGIYGALPADVNSNEFSVMTYASHIGHFPLGTVRYELLGAPQTFMMLDIASLQHMYGADYTTHSGDTEYTWDATTGESFIDGQSAIKPAGNRIFSTIWDGGANDTYNLVNYTGGVTVDLNPGGHSVFSTDQLARLGGGPNGGKARGNVFNALEYQGDARSLIENAIGGRGNDDLIGNRVDNALLGHFGDDFLTGMGGSDTLIGGDGNDWLEGDALFSHMLPVGHVAGNDTIAAGTGDDIVISGGGDDLVRGEADNDTIIGEDGNDTLYGDGGYDAIDGGEGNDVLVGGTEADVLFGGAGSDTLQGEDGADIMMGERGEVNTLGSFDILFGGAGNDQMHGGGANDWLFGEADNDVMDGGDGSDYLLGGAGVEIMLGSGASEFRSANEGSDTFAYTRLEEGGDLIWGFDTRAGEQDRIDLRSLFDYLGYTGTNPISDGVLGVFHANSTDAWVGVDADGGANSWTVIATLHGTLPATLNQDFFLFQ